MAVPSTTAVWRGEGVIVASEDKLCESNGSCVARVSGIVTAMAVYGEDLCVATTEAMLRVTPKWRITELYKHGTVVIGMHVTNDRLVVCNIDGDVTIWDLKGGHFIATVNVDMSPSMYSGLGNRVMVAHDREWLECDIDTGKIDRRQESNDIVAICVMPGPEFTNAVATENGKCCVFKSGVYIYTFNMKARGNYPVEAFSCYIVRSMVAHDGKILLTLLRDGKLIHWNLEERRRCVTLGRIGISRPFILLTSPDRHKFAVVGPQLGTVLAYVSEASVPT